MTNEYGLDVAYFKKNLYALQRDVDRYTPREMSLALERLSLVAMSQAMTIVSAQGAHDKEQEGE